MGKKVKVFHINASSCNNCDIEVLAAINLPRFVDGIEVERVEDPSEAMIITVSGFVNRKMAKHVEEILKKAKHTKVVAIGTCATSGGIFSESYNFAGPVERFIPVDAYITGCPPRPTEIVEGLKKLLSAL
jgi:Ni,Fe-hydrogenase III small subunit